MLMPRKLRIFAREDCGLAAVEFAFILPVMITMLFGMGELSMALFARNDITQISGTVADLVAQNNTVVSTDLDNVYKSANTILYPYYKTDGDAKPSIRISSVIWDTVGKSTTAGKVAWSCVQTGNLAFKDGPATGVRAINTSYTFTQPMLSSGGSVLMVEVAYNYSSPTTQAVAGAIPMTDAFYTKPRRVAQIPKPTGTPTGTSCTP